MVDMSAKEQTFAPTKQKIKQRITVLCMWTYDVKTMLRNQHELK